MSWLPISGTLPQYSTNANGLAADYYLKFYASGTSTPINMATDSTGATLLAKCALSDDGYPITNPLDDSTRFIPHIDQDYRIVLYLNETDADSNDTGSAAFNIDGMILQVTPTANAADINLKSSNMLIQDDYDRSPWFIDVEDFTAGVGPHVITVPTDWTPTNPDMRFYRLDASGIVTPLTPTSTSSTTFTLIETLLSTDVIFIGNDEFRSMADSVEEQIKINAQANFDAIKQAASETSSGVVEKATTAEMTAGTVDKFPDAEAVSEFVGRSDDTATLTRVGEFYTLNPPLDTTTYNFSFASYANDTWISIGATGSGADEELSVIPTDAKAVTFKVGAGYLNVANYRVLGRFEVSSNAGLNHRATTDGSLGFANSGASTDDIQTFTIDSTLTCVMNGSGLSYIKFNDFYGFTSCTRQASVIGIYK